MEVALLIIANEGPRVPQIIQLLDWKDTGKFYTMVLERPVPCEDLFNFVTRHGGRLNEKLARVIMRQATQAAYISCQRGVFHRDIKQENILINKESLEVKLIDFGCGTSFVAHPTLHSWAHDCTAHLNIYQRAGTMGSRQLFIPGGCFCTQWFVDLWFICGLSQEICRLICACLQSEPTQRLELGKILQHKWFEVTDVEKM